MGVGVEPEHPVATDFRGIPFGTKMGSVDAIFLRTSLSLGVSMLGLQYGAFSVLRTVVYLFPVL